MKAPKLNEFYQNKNVFITGVTGFIGKVLLIKLLHSLGGCGQVYVLIRAKKGLSCEERLSNMLKKEPFVPAPDFDNPTSAPSGQDSIDLRHIERKELQELDFSKIVAVEGDMRRDELVGEEGTREELYKNVNIIFNVAASVKWNAPLKESLQDNYLGTRNLLEFATKVNNLISLVHVSTFYTNLNLSHIEEKVLPSKIDCEKIAEMITLLPDSIVDTITPDLIENKLNSYVYTKALAENLVLKYEGRLPIAIVRPSTVMPSYGEPFPGWVDNVSGAIGPLILTCLGIIRAIDWNSHGVCDLIPVDYVANSMLAVCERTTRLQSKNIKVYNCSSGSINPVTWGQMFEFSLIKSRAVPPLKILRVPTKLPSRPSKLQLQAAKLSELLFAYLFDMILFLVGKKPTLLKITNKWHEHQKLGSFFSNTIFTCSNDNLIATYEEMNIEDREEFCFHPRKLNWNLFFENSVYASRRLICKEDLSNLSMARKKLYFQIGLEYIINFIFYVFIVTLLYRAYASFILT